MTTSGAVTLFSALSYSDCWQCPIIAGPDGALWFTEVTLTATGSLAKVGRITTTGVLTEWARQPGIGWGITVGPDGNVWSASQGYWPGDPTEPDLIAQIVLTNHDTTKPISQLAQLPAAEPDANFTVQWSGTDLGSGVRDFTIYVSDNGASFTPWVKQTAARQLIFPGVAGHTYGFYSIARDFALNHEDAKIAAEATTQVAATVPGDLNGDGMVNCTDLAIVKASMGKRTGQAGFDPRADINRDGAVDVRDLAFVSQLLPPGTRCP